MGNCFSVSLSCDHFVNETCSCLCAKAAYIHNLKENLGKMETAVQKLREKRDELSIKVEAEENRGLQIRPTVQGWISRVKAIETQFDQLLEDKSDEIQRLCLCGFASKNCFSSYEYGKKVIKILEDVEALISEEKEGFEEVAMEASEYRVDKRPIDPTIGMEEMFEKAWNRLMEDEVAILGIYGTGGVGKTTLLKQIHNKFGETTNASIVVIFVVVSQDLQVENIQEEIGKKLRISNDVWKQKRRDEKAADISRILSSKKFVLLLDDIWEKVSLADVGVPFPDKENGCKVVFTTRLEKVCGSMRVDVEIEVKGLAFDVAMNLFRAKVGDGILNSHPDIPILAETIVKKCCGLPLALVVIGETMAGKRRVEQWRHACHVLRSSATECEGMKTKILPILKYSYDNLEEKFKMCFQYCALFPEDCLIHKEGLIEYWVGEGIIDENTEEDNFVNEGFDIIGILVGACLLEDVDNEYVKMHDVVREMALWVASDCKEEEKHLVVRASARLDHVPEVKNPECARRMCLMRNNIEEIRGGPKYPELLTLLLSGNGLRSISGEFFGSVPNLVVLDLSGGTFGKLPEEIALLVSLRYLNLTNASSLRQLPNGFKELKSLVWLDLTFTTALKSVVGISSLPKLQILILIRSGVCKSCDTVEELKLMKQLRYLRISVYNALMFAQLMSNYKLADTIRELEVSSHESIPFRMSFVMNGLQHPEDSEGNSLKVLKDWQDGKQSGLDTLVLNPSTSCWQNLQLVDMCEIKGLMDLTWLLFAPNIKTLILMNIRDLKEMICRENVINGAYEQPFNKLQQLYLMGLLQMESIYWDPLPFFCLQSIHINGCPKLKKLPFNSRSAEGHILQIEIEKEMEKQFEWEDEDTKKRFFPQS